MTDLQPHRRNPQPAAPLTDGARFIRGFTRVGSITAVLAALSDAQIKARRNVHGEEGVIL